ncbi:hypothetical protein B0H17DRAFT_1146580 [Mycena rosella]|uniref:Uncharacterized protein n=1 Tax=Mycena rosella TaxID=1033263 RepID=A0AAD7CNJ3_MYCRO|nr:hypothetical protein B0H17DRAFT_1146580 [Mycena rosella]
MVPDAYTQYLEALGDDEKPRQIIVAGDSASLRVIYPIVNKCSVVECVTDSGSQIVSMSYEQAKESKLVWDPDIQIFMQSANGSLEKSVGLAKNVAFQFGDITVYLQVHIIRGPAYKILLGRPFEILTESTVQNHPDGSQTLTMKDPNSQKRCMMPTHPRGKISHTSGSKKASAGGGFSPIFDELMQQHERGEMALKFGFNQGNELEIQGYFMPKGAKFTETELQQAYLCASTDSKELKEDQVASTLLLCDDSIWFEVLSKWHFTDGRGGGMVTLTLPYHQAHGHKHTWNHCCRSSLMGADWRSSPSRPADFLQATMFPPKFAALVTVALVSAAAARPVVTSGTGDAAAIDSDATTAGRFACGWQVGADRKHTDNSLTPRQSDFPALSAVAPATPAAGYPGMKAGAIGGSRWCQNKAAAVDASRSRTNSNTVWGQPPAEDAVIEESPNEKRNGEELELQPSKTVEKRWRSAAGSAQAGLDMTDGGGSGAPVSWAVNGVEAAPTNQIAHVSHHLDLNLSNSRSFPPLLKLLAAGFLAYLPTHQDVRKISAARPSEARSLNWCLGARCCCNINHTVPLLNIGYSLTPAWLDVSSATVSRPHSIPPSLTWLHLFPNIPQSSNVSHSSALNAGPTTSISSSSPARPSFRASRTANTQAPIAPPIHTSTWLESLQDIWPHVRPQINQRPRLKTFILNQCLFNVALCHERNKPNQVRPDLLHAQKQPGSLRRRVPFPNVAATLPDFLAADDNY